MTAVPFAASAMLPQNSVIQQLQLVLNSKSPIKHDEGPEHTYSKQKIGGLL